MITITHLETPVTFKIPLTIAGIGSASTTSLDGERTYVADLSALTYVDESNPNDRGYTVTHESPTKLFDNDGDIKPGYYILTINWENYVYKTVIYNKQYQSEALTVDSVYY